MEPNHSEGLQPLVILLDLEHGSYFDLIDEICVLLRDASASALIKGGSVIEPRGSRRGVNVSTFDPQRGRVVERETRGREIGMNYAEYGEAFGGSRRIDSDDPMPASQLFGNWPECISISDLGEELAEQVVQLARTSGMLVAAYRWSPDNPAASRLLWRQLILTRIVSTGVILRHYEEVPINLITNEETLEWERDREPFEPADGFFFDDDWTGQIFPESLYLHVPLPPDLRIARPRKYPRTPLQTALREVGREVVLRIGGMDDPDSPGHFSLPYYGEQYPDVVESEKRINSYCLNRSHPAKKWEGFASHGWGTHPLDSIRLAAYFCSALMLDFNPYDVTVTADGAIQFGVDIAMPSRKYVYMPTTTAWLSEPDAPLRLTTAFVTSSNRAFDPVFEADEEALDWDETVASSRRFGLQMPFEPMTRAAPRLFVQRMGRANELTKKLVREGNRQGDFERAPLGRTLLVRIGEDLMPWSQASRTSAHAQVELGIKGIRSRIGTWVD